MPEFTKCPYCGLSEFSSRSARDNHVYKCKRKSSKSVSHSDPLPNSSSQPERKPPEYFTRFDGRKAPLTEAELLGEGIDWLKSKIMGKKSSPQPEESIRPPTVTDLAVQRARELNGEIPQFESYTPSSEAQSQSQPAQISSHPHIGETLKSLVSRVFPQKKQPEFPDNTYNEWGQPLFHWKCLSCGNWVSTNDVAIHQAEGHSIIYVG